MKDTQGFRYLGHSNWTIFSLLNWFCPRIFPSSWSLYWGSHFLLPQRAENEEKGLTKKMEDTQGFQYLGHSNWTIFSLLNGFWPKQILSSWALYCSGCDRRERTVRSVLNGQSVLFYQNHFGLPFLITPESGIREKGIHPKMEDTQGFPVLGAFKLDHFQPVKLILS